MIHVAGRFGALKKWIDLSNVSLRSLMKSFEGTVIYKEALKEIFSKDLDLKSLIKLFERIKNGEIEVVKIETSGEPTPVARLGIEKASMKTDLIPPEKMKRLLIESTKARLLDETRTFVCTQCWDYLEMINMKELPEKPTCPRCGSPDLGMLRVEEGDAYPLLEKKNEKLTKNEEKLRDEAVETAKLISKYGKPAAIALSARRLKLSDAKEVLSKETALTDEFFEAIIEAEKNALKRRFL
jgi:ATP-dependent Lhr-like helicase